MWHYNLFITIPYLIKVFSKKYIFDKGKQTKRIFLILYITVYKKVTAVYDYLRRHGNKILLKKYACSSQVSRAVT